MLRALLLGAVLSLSACSELPPAQTAQIVVSSSARVLELVAQLLTLLDDSAAKCQVGESLSPSTPDDQPAAD